MLIKLTFKTPDVVDEAAADVALQEAPSDVDAQFDVREEVREACKPWVQYGEYCTIEIDSEAGTATVLPARV